MAQRTRVLIVEDDADVRNSTAEYLASHDFEVDVADCGDAMRAALDKAVPQLALFGFGLVGLPELVPREAGTEHARGDIDLNHAWEHGRCDVGERFLQVTSARRGRLARLTAE